MFQSHPQKQLALGHRPIGSELPEEWPLRYQCLPMISTGQDFPCCSSLKGVKQLKRMECDCISRGLICMRLTWWQVAGGEDPRIVTLIP